MDTRFHAFIKREPDDRSASDFDLQQRQARQFALEKAAAVWSGACALIAVRGGTLDERAIEAEAAWDGLTERLISTALSSVPALPRTNPEPASLPLSCSVE